MTGVCSRLKAKKETPSLPGGSEIRQAGTSLRTRTGFQNDGVLGAEELNSQKGKWSSERNSQAYSISCNICNGNVSHLSNIFAVLCCPLVRGLHFRG